MPGDDPFRRGLPGPGAVDDPLRVEAGRDEEAGHLGHEAQLEVGIGREALRRAEVVPEAEIGEGRDAVAGRREHRREVIPVRPELDEALGGDARGRKRLAVRLERADHEPAAVVADVQVAIEVAQERQVLGRGGRLVGHDPDVLGRVERDARAGEAGELRGPETGRQDDGLGLDGAARGVEAGDAAGRRGRAGSL